MTDDARHFDADRYAIARLRLKDAPLDLTDDDLALLGVVSAALVREATEARRVASLARVPRPVVATKSAAPPATVEDIDPARKVTWGTVKALLDAVVTAHKAQKGRIDELERLDNVLQERLALLESAVVAEHAPR